jgi:hypothetical protein
VPERPRLAEHVFLDCGRSTTQLMRDSLGSVAMALDKSSWIIADFNGIIGPGLLCISHWDTAINHAGRTIRLQEGMELTAFAEDSNEAGHRDDLVASGVVQPTLPDLGHTGSRWVLRIDSHGIRHESDLGAEA